MTPACIENVAHELLAFLNTSYVFKPGYELVVSVSYLTIKIRLFNKSGDVVAKWNNEVPSAAELQPFLA